LQRPADGRIGAVSLPETIAAAVESDLVPDRAAYNDPGAAWMRRRQGPVEVIRGLKHASNRGNHDREIGRPTAGHRGIGGDTLQGRDDPAWRHRRKGFVVAAAGFHQGRDLLFRRYHQREPVAPALRQRILVPFVEIELPNLDEFGVRRLRHFGPARNRLR